MAFADALIAACDADVVLVDRSDPPGCHWNDACPFVRLHQPSAFYGVNSRMLGGDSIDTAGPNAGFYERATAAQICAYYQQVLDERLLASGRVRFFGLCDCLSGAPGERSFVSRLTGETTTVRVRRRVVDARYLETSVPATHTPSFGAEPAPGHGCGLDRDDLHCPARPRRVAPRPRPGRLDRWGPAQRRAGDPRSPGRTEDEVSARPPVRQHRASHRQARDVPDPDAAGALIARWLRGLRGSGHRAGCHLHVVPCRGEILARALASFAIVWKSGGHNGG